MMLGGRFAETEHKRIYQTPGRKTSFGGLKNLSSSLLRQIS